jgi:hypothetical protein
LKCLVLAVALLLLAALPSFAAGELGGTVKVGTLGPGADLTIGLPGPFNLRLNGNYLPSTKIFSSQISGIDYDFKAEFESLGALLDFHPFGGGFRVSAGAMWNNNKLKVHGSPSSNQTYTINNHTYTGSQIGNLDGDADFNSVAPYLGVGWGNAVGKDSRWHFCVDVGAIYQGDSSVNIRASNPTNNAQLTADINHEVRELEDKADRVRWYPVVALGISWAF